MGFNHSRILFKYFSQSVHLPRSQQIQDSLHSLTVTQRRTKRPVR
jgi:hypothetical protein